MTFSLKLTGVAAGLANGLFGSGGGMIAVPALVKSGAKQSSAQASALGALLPLSIGTAAAYFLAGDIGFDALVAALGALPGGYIGARLAKKLPGKWLGRLFAAVMLWAGVRMCFFST